jgi:catechol 2,3-dioxygenase-like lactoylglutathione lyase family enzyme
MGIVELGHAGVHCHDLDVMRDFYSRVLGLTVTDEEPSLGIVFLSSRPDEEHHEFVLAKGRNVPEDAKLINQVSWRVSDVASLQSFHKTFLAEGVRIASVVTHGNAIGIYFLDPEGNKLEVYWQTGLDVAQPFMKPISLEGSPQDIADENARLVSADGPVY